MSDMTHRERVLAAINLEKPDRVPLDFGSTIATTIILPGYEKLKTYLGLEHENRILLQRQGSIIPHESVLKRFDIDTRGFVLGSYKGGNAKEIDDDTFMDIWQTTWKRPPGGHYINVDGPFQNRDADMDDLETFDWPDPDNPGLFEGIREKAEALRKQTDCAVILNLGVGIVHQGQFMRGFAEWFMDLRENPNYVSRLCDILTEIWIRIAKNALEQVGDNVDIVAYGDDVAMQQGPLIHPKLYQKIVKPRHARMNATCKAQGDVKIWYHSCGSVYALMDDIIDVGVDILNPVQVAAKDMDPDRLKEEYGDRICFWGGIDTQHTLPFGTPDEVRTETRHIIDTLGRGGGYVLNSVHNMQKDVPPENIVAMFDEARSYGVYDH